MSGAAAVALIYFCVLGIAFAVGAWISWRHRHEWSKWESYEQSYGVIIPRFRGDPNPPAYSRTRLRQKRRCATCGATEDVVVAELHA